MTLSRKELKKLQFGNVVRARDGQYVVLDTQESTFTGGLILSARPPRLHVVNSCILDPRTDRVPGNGKEMKSEEEYEMEIVRLV